MKTAQDVVARAIENGFPFEALSRVAEVESYRKEVNRPVYYLHKWWAKRLGTIFRAAILGAVLPEDAPVMEKLYERVDLDGLVVFDPFMGSGVTVGEAHKLGCTAVGQDINPVAYRSVKAALGPLDRKEVMATYELLERTIGDELRALYRSVDSNGNPCEVLYYFWVMTAACPKCSESVDLFSSYEFARHAYPKKYPRTQVVCPSCDAVFPSLYKSTSETCPQCKTTFDPQRGSTRRTTATCGCCKEEFAIAKAIRTAGKPPSYRLYAKLVLREDGEKEYLSITDDDRTAYEAAKARQQAMEGGPSKVEIAKGYNTNQILNYGYRSWDQLFNARQLLGLTLLGDAIRALPDGSTKDAFMCLFSGILEFNNMFASYKGEGTGAVRHMFSDHILKPERTPIEANIWGTPKSSGAFSKLYESRLLRAIDYRENPFELAIDEEKSRKGKLAGRKIEGINPPMGAAPLDFPGDGPLVHKGLYLSCGSSTRVALPASSVDLVVTDPPFFDNVHYSELADFFYAWQRWLFGERAETTRQATEEVQDTKVHSFAKKLQRVFKECHRVLRDDGMMVFSYHHSRDEGWTAVAEAVTGAGFSIVGAQPVRAEMSVAAPKARAKSPISIDVLVGCRKRELDGRPWKSVDDTLSAATRIAASKVARFVMIGQPPSRNDVQVIVLSQLLVELSAGRSTAELLQDLEGALREARQTVDAIYENQEQLAKHVSNGSVQLILFGERAERAGA